ncbi:MAG TPA: hypothetical protein DER60_01905 [Syntrophomonas sp.]|jgi:nucleoside-triphosphatase THEP1|nr:hypothetical protein [Syntrophomonas sp.]
MVFIICGPINSGKSTRMAAYYHDCHRRKADGLISRKLYKGSTFVGYELTRLSNGEKRLLALLNDYYRDQFEECFSFGPYVFSGAAFEFGEKVLEEMLDDDNLKYIFLDEIGPIELEGRGFWRVFQRLLNSDKHLFIGVRDQCLAPVLSGLNQACCIVTDAGEDDFHHSAPPV